MPIIGKAKLLEMLLDWQNGLAVDRVARRHKLSYNRLKKAFNTLIDPHRQGNLNDIAVELMYEAINKE